MNSVVTIRETRAGEGAGCARGWSDAGRYRRDIDPAAGQLPVQDSIAGYFETACAQARPPQELWLAADCDGDVAGFVQALMHNIAVTWVTTMAQPWLGAGRPAERCPDPQHRRHTGVVGIFLSATP